jgi:catechol 2,3-dioxygenase-like lactoylglutathione lyase family enzyme
MFYRASGNPDIPAQAGCVFMGSDRQAKTIDGSGECGGIYMLGYATVGSNRLDDAKAFYDNVFASIGWAPLFEHGSGGRVYGGDNTMFAVVAPFDGDSATVGNGTMIGFSLASHELVDKFHATVLAAGGSDEGAPGPRGPEEAKAYMAYVRDLDGNKLTAFKIG